MKVQNRRVRATPPGERRVEVAVEPTPDGARSIILRDLSYGAGVGWFVQKTIRLDPQHLDALMGALCCARQQAGKAGGHCLASTANLAAECADPKVVSIEAFLPTRRAGTASAPEPPQG